MGIKINLDCFKIKDINLIKIIKEWVSELPNNSVIDLAKRLKLEVYKIETLDSDYSGELVVEEESKIYVNANHPETRQRFTIAHEIAHYVLGHGSRKRDGKSVKEEFEANQFAAEILMPEEYIREYIESRKNWTLGNIIESLSEELHVSKDAVKVRISSLFGRFLL